MACHEGWESWDSDCLYQQNGRHGQEFIVQKVTPLAVLMKKWMMSHQKGMKRTENHRWKKKRTDNHHQRKIYHPVEVRGDRWDLAWHLKHDQIGRTAFARQWRPRYTGTPTKAHTQSKPSSNLQNV